METKIITLTAARVEELFPAEEEGQNVRPTVEAVVMAHEALGLKIMRDIQWHLPDVFAVRYGSCYVGTAKFYGQAVRFVTDFGNWQEGDDK